jgi:hypothetical protein
MSLLGIILGVVNYENGSGIEAAMSMAAIIVLIATLSFRD